MTKKQKAQVAVQKAVKEVMDKNQAKWQAVAELKNRVEQFNSNLARIDKYVAILQTDLAPLKKKKVTSRKVLVEQVFPVTSVMGVFSMDIGDKKLCKLAGVKFTDLEKMSNESLLKYGIRILKISETLLAQTREEGKKSPKHLIADYGLTVKHMEALQAALDGCSIEASDCPTTRREKNKRTRQLDRRIRENNMLLNKTMDRMMHLFRDNQKAFYNAYIKARISVEKEAEMKAPAADATTAGKPPAAEKPPAAVKETAAGKKTAASASPATAAAKPKEPPKPKK